MHFPPIKLSLLVFVSILLSFGACKTGKKTKTTESTAASAEVVLSNLRNDIIDFEWFSGKARLGISSKELSIQTNANIRIVKDSLIWVNVSKLGFEVGRALITRDSVFVIDRIQRQYAIKSLESIFNDYDVPVNFGHLQDLLIGVPFSENREKPTLNQKGEHLTLSYLDQNGIKVNYLIHKALNELVEMEISDPNGHTLEARFDQYKTEDDGNKFSYFRKYNLPLEKEGNYSLEMKFSKTEFNIPKSLYFEIPKKYKRYD